MQTYLLFTEDFDAALAEIKKVGGAVTQKFTSTVFVANLPDSIDVSYLQNSTLEQSSDLDEVSNLMVKSWKYYQEKQSNKLKTTSDKLISWGTQGMSHPKNIKNDNVLRKEFEEKRGFNSTGSSANDTMTGDIALGLVIVSGPQGLAFSGTEYNIAVSEVQEGCQFLATKGQQYNVTFVYVTRLVTIDAQPNNGCNSYESCESVFRDPALKILGYQPGYAGCLSYIDNLIANNNTNWGYMAFITKYPLFWFAYAYPDIIFMEYSNDNWGPNNINLVFAHETCHVFGAADEYPSSMCICAPSGYYQVPNYNCVNCTDSPFPKVPCLMNHNNLTLCEWTKGQLGWSYWEGDRQVIGVGMSCSPAIMVYNNLLYCFHQGYGASGSLYYSIFNGSSWQPDQLITSDSMSASPAVMVYNNLLYCFHQGYGASGSLHYNVFDGSNWQPDQQIANVGISGSPALIVYNNLLYCFHQGYGASGALCYSIFDGNSWQPDLQIANVGMSEGPAVIVYNNLLYCFHQGYGASGSLHYSVFDGSNWLPDQRIPGVGMSGSPAVIVYNNLLYCFHQGYGANGTLCYSIFDGDSWQPDLQITNVSMTDSPAFAIYNGSLYCFHQGYKLDGQLWYNKLIDLH